jgi:acyl-CoA synthetase (AMP-forming)/AMP-acid ligase II
MWPGVHAQKRPDHPAVVLAGSGAVVTYAELEDRSRRLARVWEENGLGFGDHVALLIENQARFFEVCWAAQRSGLYYTAVNTHLTAEEVAYIVEDCDAQALVTTAAMGAIAVPLAPLLTDAVTSRLAMDGAVPGYEPYEDALASVSGEARDDEVEGHAMLYSSGTTGRPKGVRFPLQHKPLGEPGLAVEGFRMMYRIGEDTVYLSTAPCYHAAPLQFCMAVQRLGGTAVVMEQFDAEASLAAIEAHRVTHSQWVPTMFVRLCKLPAEVRERYDLSSQQVVLHAAAPCPLPVKEQMIDWWGPIVSEYYSSTEAIGATVISSEEWLAHKGSVGRPVGAAAHICDEDGADLPVGEIGVVWFERPVQGLAFDYHKDPTRTADAHDDRGWATNGDMGRLDEDGYLYLTDRRDFMIVSGGVNIYPQEAEDVLITHSLVADAAVFGVPDAEMGEQVKAVVQPLDPEAAGPELEQVLLAHCREHLAHYKCPKTVDFDAELPRLDTGKLYKRLLRDRYWGDQESRIV